MIFRRSRRRKEVGAGEQPAPVEDTGRESATERGPDPGAGPDPGEETAAKPGEPATEAHEGHRSGGGGPGGEASTPPDGEERPRGVFGRLRDALARTRRSLAGGLAEIFSRERLDEDELEEMEMLLLAADVGVEATERIVSELRRKVRRREVRNGQEAYAALRESMLAILRPVEQPLRIPRDRERPFVILMVGVNGAGKTTTIGKLSHLLRQEGFRVMLAAGDTFRAAAVEQLQIWGQRIGVPVVAQHTGADSASVVFDALQSATARGHDVVIADTAGRLHTQAGLMDELAKIRRVLGKIDPEAPHETLLVLDATTGQNALVQAEQFTRAVGVTGIVLTKLDGTAKGGILFAVAERLGLPVRFIGVGEGVEDLRPFSAEAFVDAVLAREEP